MEQFQAVQYFFGSNFKCFYKDWINIRRVLILTHKKML